MVFQIWDTESANMIGAFTDEDAALRAVCEAIEAHGRDYVATWALECEDDQGQIGIIAQGPALAEHARQHTVA